MSEVKMLTVKEVAEQLRVSRMTVYRLVKDEGNPLGAVVVRGSVRIPQSGLDAYLERP